MTNIKEIWNGPRLHERPHSQTTEGKLQTLLRTHSELRGIPQDRLPTHMLIIPDGNGRWAKSHHLSTLEGHRKGKDVVIKLLRDLRPLEQIKFITLWGMSADNFDKRDPEEKENLFEIFEETLIELTPELMEENGKFVHLGRKDRIPQRLLQIFNDTEALTSENTGQTVSLAVDYGGQDQELRLIQKALTEIPKDTIITIQDIEKLRDGGGKVPPADLVLRTSGEVRTSGLGWLGEKAEFVAINELFPTIGTNHIVKGLVAFSKRERRGGGRSKTT